MSLLSESEEAHGESDVVIDGIFEEEYDSGSSSESEDERAASLAFSKSETDIKLGISNEQAIANLNAAGREVYEDPDRITVAGNLDLMDSKANDLLDSVVEKLQMPYAPAEFQRVVVNGLAKKKNIVLVSPTGSGKMNIPLLATHVLREVFNIPKGISIITQPLSSIMNEKINNGICKSAVLTMRGELSTTSEENSHLSCDLADLLNGEIDVLFGHPESFDSPLGRLILKELQKRDRIILGMLSNNSYIYDLSQEKKMITSECVVHFFYL